ncbi:MAG: hypothetical protein HY747_08290 [Elusimicrobia bacterium]|nr:hypothetical protein [Elusimicrobiota bacterium]
MKKMIEAFAAFAIAMGLSAAAQAELTTICTGSASKGEQQCDVSTNRIRRYSNYIATFADTKAEKLDPNGTHRLLQLSGSVTMTIQFNVTGVGLVIPNGPIAYVETSIWNDFKQAYNEFKQTPKTQNNAAKLSALLVEMQNAVYAIWAPGQEISNRTCPSVIEAVNEKLEGDDCGYQADEGVCATLLGYTDFEIVKESSENYNEGEEFCTVRPVGQLGGGSQKSKKSKLKGLDEYDAEE